MRNLKQIYERYVDNDNADFSWELEFNTDVTALLKVEVAKAKIEELEHWLRMVQWPYTYHNMQKDMRKQIKELKAEVESDA